jgi:hypothetical protein
MLVNFITALQNCFRIYTFVFALYGGTKSWRRRRRRGEEEEEEEEDINARALLFLPSRIDPPHGRLARAGDQEQEVVLPTHCEMFVLFPFLLSLLPSSVPFIYHSFVFHSPLHLSILQPPNGLRLLSFYSPHLAQST